VNNANDISIVVAVCVGLIITARGSTDRSLVPERHTDRADYIEEVGDRIALRIGVTGAVTVENLELIRWVTIVLCAKSTAWTR
jgi:hypothetical protein